MGCILACLRFDKRKNKARLKSSPVPSKTREPLLANDQFVSVFVTEGSSNEQALHLNHRGGSDQDNLEKELRDEAEFLKSCGTILETPVELRNSSAEVTAQLSSIASNDSSNFTATPFKKLAWAEHCEDSDLSQNSPAIFRFGEHGMHEPLPSENVTQIMPHYSVENSPKIESDAKSVSTNASPYTSTDARLENNMQNPIEPEVESINQNISPTKDESPQQFTSKKSPYPTPLTISEEMETPLTVYPSTQGKTRRKNTKIRTQFVYPILKGKGNENDKRSPSREEFEQEGHDSFKRLKSLKEWVKLVPEDNEKNHSKKNENKTPLVERPIFGFATLNWDENDAAKESPKLWGGNGIPNTTTKYKEDQKVTWHATPFEERLDKALSDEKFLPQRKEVVKNLTKFNAEGEECFV